MSKVLAVALLDCRRLGFGLASGALVAGLIPALASGLGSKDGSGADILVVAFAVVGIAAGATFGSDFNDGKSSFFFARPLSAGVLIAGRFAALLTLAGGVFVSFMAVSWLASNARTGWTLSVLNRWHAEALGTGWALSLFVSLATAARARALGSEGGIRALAMIPVRLGLHLGAFLLLFGLFADLVLRAYRNDFTPIRLFIGSWVVASLVASCVAIAWGRTERLRIARLQGRVMIAHFALVSLVVVTAWTYVLHPGPDAIRALDHWSWGSPDGRMAFVPTKVGRGDGQTFRPVFVLDIAAGQALRLNADPYQGPWTSADGATMVWSEATPFFFRPLWRAMGGATTFRVKTASGEIVPLPMPARLPDYRRARDLSNFGGEVERVLPSPDGDVFAILWNRTLFFTSRSRGELADVNLGPGRPRVHNTIFLPSGDLRATISRQAASGATGLEFVDINPQSGTMKTVASLPTENPVRVQLDARAGRALLTATTIAGRGGSISLVDLNGPAGRVRPTVLLSDVLFPRAIFLADGRIAATGGGSVGAWNKRILRIFSPAGQVVIDIPLGDGSAPRLGSEMFPGIVAVGTGTFTLELSLIDVASGAVVRRLPDMFSLGESMEPTAPPGTAAARLIESRDGRLFELPSPTAEPRLLLPLPTR